MKGFLRTSKGNIRWTDLVENGHIKFEYGKLISVDPKLSGVLYLDESVIGISEQCFKGCKGLKQIVLNDDLQLIGTCAFAMCTNLQQLVIPGSVTKIGMGITVGCIKLEKLQVDPSNPYYISENNCIIEDDVIIAGCKESTIRNHRGIAKYAFGCITRDKWDIFNIETVRDGAFYACDIKDLLISTDALSDCMIQPSAFKDSKLEGVTLSGNINYEKKFFNNAAVYEAGQVMNVEFGGDIQQVAIFGGDQDE